MTTSKTNASGTELALYQGERYAIVEHGGRDMALALQDSLAPGETLDVFNLPIVKIPAGGGRAFDLPTGEAAQSFDGIIILRQPVRAYWRESFAVTGGGSPPDCSSADSIRGEGDPGGACASCRLSDYGSATGDDGGQKAGQACRQITRLFVLRPESLLPTLLLLPPSSYKAAKDYVVGTLAAHSRHYSAVTTRIGLEQAQSRDGIKYSRVTLEIAGLLSPEDEEAITEYRKAIIPSLRGMTVTQEEMV